MLVEMSIFVALGGKVRIRMGKEDRKGDVLVIEGGDVVGVCSLELLEEDGGDDTVGRAEGVEMDGLGGSRSGGHC